MAEMWSRFKKKLIEYIYNYVISIKWLIKM